MRLKSGLYSLLLLVAGSGCTENETFVYTTKPAVYFGVGQELQHFSFAGHIGDTAIINLDVRLLGKELDSEKRYAIRVDEENTTVIEGVHYKKLNDLQIFPGKKFNAILPVEVYRTPDLLLDTTFYLALTLVDAEEMDAGYPKRISAKIGITGHLVKPGYWDGWINLYFGEYSRMKHTVCISIMGHDFPLSEAEARGSKYGPTYWMVMGRAVYTYFMENPTLDENGNPITLWEPF